MEIDQLAQMNLNFFSLYCASHMLIDPDIPDETLLRELSVAVVGEEYADVFAEMLNIIQDARTGNSYDTFFWSGENYILKSSDYPAQDIFAGCEECIPVLQEMIDAGVEGYSLPIPISLNEVLRMMMPHLQQIN